MEKYICLKCASDKYYIKPSGKRFGVYCSKCGNEITAISYAKAQGIYQNKKNMDLNENQSFKTLKSRNGVKTMKCSKCNCLLYNSAMPKVMGQFNLVNAKYCPNCGRELI